MDFPFTLSFGTNLLACIPLGLGLIWCAFDSRKQGWHDKLAKTVVVRKRTPKEVVFEKTA